MVPDMSEIYSVRSFVLHENSGALSLSVRAPLSTFALLILHSYRSVDIIILWVVRHFCLSSEE